MPWLLLIGGLIGLTASFVLTAEKFTLATNPAYIPTCSLNPVLNCGSVMDTPQAAVLGFPNSLLGIAGFAAITTTGAALLAGAQLKQWFWVSLQIGATLAAAFVHWLIFQSIYTIGALCPYCMVVWAVAIPIFWYITLRNLSLWGTGPNGQRMADLARMFHPLPITIWALAVAGLIAIRFWSYWSSLL
nr:vitamin K epoxide reductase family protein [Rhodococcus sp. SGAir0479]